MLIAGEDTRRHRLLAGRHLVQCVGLFVEPPQDVIEFEAIKLVL